MRPVSTPVRVLALLVALSAALLLVAALSSCTGAVRRPDWQLARVVPDGPVTARRYQFHALRATGGAVAYGTARWAGMAPDVAEVAADLAAGVLPHGVGLVTGSARPFNAPDWAADLGFTAIGASLARRCTRLWSKRCGLAVLAAGGAYAALAPWGSP